MPGSSDIDSGRLGEQIDSLSANRQLRQIAARVPAYLVGGVVRDLLLGRHVTDLDVAIEGDPEALTDLPGFSLERDGLFLTGRLEQGDVKIDVAQSRAETYPEPGALPEVRPASITEDLARRDFTVNAMAFSVSGGRDLLDPHGGLEDLRAGLLRVLHQGSFADDPTRALRAARYAARFGFELDADTARLLRDADLSAVSEDRIDNELRRISAEEDPAAALGLIAEWGLMPSLDPEAPGRVAEVTRLASAPPWSDWRSSGPCRRSASWLRRPLSAPPRPFSWRRPGTRRSCSSPAPSGRSGSTGTRTNGGTSGSRSPATTCSQRASPRGPPWGGGSRPHSQASSMERSRVGTTSYGSPWRSLGARFPMTEGGSIDHPRIGSRFT
jgi:hypothetical protein